MKTLTIQDLITNAQQSMNESEDQQYMDVTADLLHAIAELQCFDDEQIMKRLFNLSDTETKIIKKQVIRLMKLFRVSHNIYVGRRVAKGIIAGTRIIDGVQEALVAGPDFYQWQKVDEIKL